MALIQNQIAPADCVADSIAQVLTCHHIIGCQRHVKAVWLAEHLWQWGRQGESRLPQTLNSCFPFILSFSAGSTIHNKGAATLSAARYCSGEESSSKIQNPTLKKPLQHFVNTPWEGQIEAWGKKIRFKR